MRPVVIWSICLLLLCSSTSSYAHSLKKLRVGWVSAMGNAPLLIAKHNGFFKQAGIKVDLVEFDSGPLIKRAIEAGDLDMAYMGMPAMSRIVADGTDLKIVAKVSYGNAALITKKNSPIQKLVDLKSRRIAGVRKGSGMDILLRGHVLTERARLDPKHDVTILHMPAKMMDASLKRGVVDAAFTWEPFISLAVLTGETQVIFDSNKELPRHPWYVVVARGSTLGKHRKEVYMALDAHQRAVEYLRTDPHAGMSIIINTFNLEKAVNFSSKKILAEEVVLEARKRLGWECQFRQSDRKFLQQLIDYTRQLGYMDKKLRADDLIDDAAIEYLRHEDN